MRRPSAARAQRSTTARESSTRCRPTRRARRRWRRTTAPSSGQTTRWRAYRQGAPVRAVAHAKLASGATRGGVHTFRRGRVTCAHAHTRSHDTPPCGPDRLGRRSTIQARVLVKSPAPCIAPWRRPSVVTCVW
uniref:Uncharacterized protein n=1 Tax=Emiliania huxleyi (strain CCMP1516) TaxID=280463 RepID=A0A0D3L130_EMIH1